MKKALGLGLAFLLNIAVLSYLSGQYGWGNLNGIRGEGSSVSRDVSLSPFTGFKLSIPADVHLRQGNTQSVRIEGQANIIDNISLEVESGVWRINFKNSVRDASNIHIYITIPTLTQAAISGSGSILGESAFRELDKLNLAISGSGNILLDFSANEVQTRLSGSGDIKLSGNARSQQMNISGSGDIEAFGLVSENAQVIISGSGSCELHTSQSLQATVSGSGDVFYKGNPTQVQSKVSGSGDITPRS